MSTIHNTTHNTTSTALLLLLNVGNRNMIKMNMNFLFFFGSNNLNKLFIPAMRINITQMFSPMLLEPILQLFNWFLTESHYVAVIWMYESVNSQFDLFINDSRERELCEGLPLLWCADAVVRKLLHSHPVNALWMSYPVIHLHTNTPRVYADAKYTCKTV